MAMSKKDLAEIDALRVQLAEATALRNLTLSRPQVVSPVNQGPDVSGIWWMNPYPVLGSVHYPHVIGCVGLGRRKGTFSHSTSESGSSFTQGAGVFYASRKDALLALRDAVVSRFATSLAAVDAELAKEA